MWSGTEVGRKAGDSVSGPMSGHVGGLAFGSSRAGKVCSLAAFLLQMQRPHLWLKEDRKYAGVPWLHDIVMVLCRRQIYCLGNTDVHNEPREENSLCSISDLP